LIRLKTRSSPQNVHAILPGNNPATPHFAQAAHRANPKLPQFARHAGTGSPGAAWRATQRSFRRPRVAPPWHFSRSPNLLDLKRNIKIKPVLAKFA
jgi:hypothetical protein